MLRRPRRCSRTGRRHTCSAAATKLFDFNDISFPRQLSPLQNSDPCNSFFYCIGHFKSVYDDDDYDDDDDSTNSPDCLPNTSERIRFLVLSFPVFHFFRCRFPYGRLS